MLRCHLKTVRTCSPDVSGKCKKGCQFTSNSCEREISRITLHPCATCLDYTVTSELGILTLVFQEPKMGGLKLIITKEARILICQARSNGSTIKELCSSFGLTRRMVVRILRRNLILPVDNGQLPTDSGRCPSSDEQRSILHMKKVLRSNPYLTIEQLNIRYPKIFNDCCLERLRQLTRDN